MPNPHLRISTADPYGGYEADDAALGGIGRAATAPIPAPLSAGSGRGGYTNNQIYGTGTIHTPQPQHLVGPDTSQLLRSPVSDTHGLGHHSFANGGPGQSQAQGYDDGQHDGYQNNGPGMAGAGPPSYGTAIGGGGGGGGGGYAATSSRPEKSGYH